MQWTRNYGSQLGAISHSLSGEDIVQRAGGDEILNRVGAEHDYRASRGEEPWHFVSDGGHHFDIRARFAPLFGYLSKSPYRDSFGAPASEYTAADPSLRNFNGVIRCHAARAFKTSDSL